MNIFSFESNQITAFFASMYEVQNTRRSKLHDLVLTVYFRTRNVKIYTHILLRRFSKNGHDVSSCITQSGRTDPKLFIEKCISTSKLTLFIASIIPLIAYVELYN